LIRDHKHTAIGLNAALSSLLFQLQNVTRLSVKEFLYVKCFVELLRRIPRWWSPIISSAYGVNLGCRMMDKILYIADKSYMPV
jgi:hypothetical protein